jgi:hypothetical protein
MPRERRTIMPIGTVHYTKIPELPPEDPFHREWNFFRREVPRLLAEGHEGKFALVKDETLIGLYDNFGDGLEAGYRKVGFVPFLLKQILTEDPLYFSPWCPPPCRS